MSMYGFDASLYDYGFSDPAITSSLYGESLYPMAAGIDYDNDAYVRRRPPPSKRSTSKTPSSPPKHRHDGTSPLPLGMDWSLPPRVWDGRNSVWPHDSHTGWSYCVTIPSWTILPSASGSDTVFFRVQVGIQSPEGITTTRGVLRRFNEFLKLYSELRKEFPKKNLPPAPPRRLMKMRSRTLLEERRRALEDWVEKLFSDIDVSRTALVAIFLELEAAARSSFSELNEDESAAKLDPSDQFPSNSGISLLTSSSSIASDLVNVCAHETSDLSAPRLEKDNHAECNIDSASGRGVVGSMGETFMDNSTASVVDGLREDTAEGKRRILNQQKMLYGKGDSAIDGCRDDVMVESFGLDSDLGGLAWESSVRGVERNAGSIGACKTSNLGLLRGSLGDSSLEQSATRLQGDSVIALPSRDRHQVITMQQKLGTTKMGMEDLIARLNQEIVARQYLTTKVKDLEMELETRSQSSKENLQQAISTEREKSTDMPWDMEELRTKCMELESRLAAEQDARAYVESMRATAIQQNESLLKELDDAKVQVGIMRKQHDEVELKLKSDLKLLVTEVESLRTSHLELKQELSKCSEEKVELEKEKQQWEVGNVSKVKLLHQCEVLCNQLRECSVDFLVDEEEKLIVDANLSDAVDLLETSDTQIGLILAEAQLLAHGAETATGTANQDDSGDTPINRDDKLRMLLADMFTDNAKLRKQVNYVIRHALTTPGKTSKVETLV